MIRRARLSDVPSIVRLGQKFAVERRKNTTLPVREENITAFVVESIADPSRVVLVCDDVAGVVVGTTYIHPFSGERTAYEVFWWVDPDTTSSGIRSRALFRGLEKWARENGATMCQMSAPCGSKVGRLYQRLGYGEVETSYQRRL